MFALAAVNLEFLIQQRSTYVVLTKQPSAFIPINMELRMSRLKGDYNSGGKAIGTGYSLLFVSH